MKRFPSLWLAILATVSLQQSAFVHAESPVSTPLIRDRGLVSKGNESRLAAVMAKARRGEDICVAAIGGSITAGGLQTKEPKNRYIARVADWFTQTFPKAKVRFVNAGIGGTNSLYGAMRVQRDVLSKKPDLVIVEYAVNDNHPVPMFWGSYEGVLRQILSEPQQPAVVQLFFMQRKGENAQETQHMLGRHYNLPMVSFRDAWWPEIYSGRAKWEVMYADVVHPNDTGHILASELLIALLNDVNHNPPAATSASASRADLPAPMITDLFADCRYAQYADLKPAQNSGWTQTPDGTKWESPASTEGGIEFGFAGKLLFVGYDIDEEAERFASFSIDGGAAQPLRKSPNRLPLAEDLAPGQHRVRIEFAGSKVPPGSTAKVRIWAVGAAGASK
ncbi:SGNH/GDSL hydrolase family protein [Prosthecobacter sp.]|uniref:SGNH/GDSL hydrolase family protein n=1 Tax=Prosthecobacter sp. TaxID=1965333 RepID=UPI002487224B|nr:SGNH/GDSL hydrolase family protein [Prosthecobacter sp.]MDI1313632.1 GDSL-type esterase/lipase family protein [Prosthecobacter sp.]